MYPASRSFPRRMATENTWARFTPNEKIGKTLAECSRKRNRRVGRALGEPHHPGREWWGSPKARPTLHFGPMIVQLAKVLPKNK